MTSIAQLLRKRLQVLAQKRQDKQPGGLQRWRATATTLCGFLLGVLVTLSSVGVGALGTVAVLILYPQLTTLRVVVTDLAFAIPLTTVAGLGHWQLGNVDSHLLGSLLIGSLPGIWIGSHLSAKIPERILRPILAVLLFLLGVKFVL